MSVLLIRDGAPFEVGKLNEGDVLTYELLTGEVLVIVDKDGNETWRSEKVVEGRRNVGAIHAKSRPVVS